MSTKQQTEKLFENYVKYDTKKVQRNLGLAIRYVRKKKELTLSDISKESHITPTTMSGIELGKNETVKLDTLLKICNALEISVEDLIYLCEKDNFWWNV